MVKLRVNGQEQLFDGDPSMPLLWYLRDELGLTGTKYSCGVARGVDAAKMQARLNLIRTHEFPEVPQGGSVWVFAVD